MERPTARGNRNLIARPFSPTNSKPRSKLQVDCPLPQTREKPDPSSRHPVRAATASQFINQSVSRPRLAVRSQRNRATRRSISAAGRYQRRRGERQQRAVDPLPRCVVMPHSVRSNTLFAERSPKPASRKRDARMSTAAENTPFHLHPQTAPIRLGAHQHGVEFPALNQRNQEARGAKHLAN
jgi:hypothetical protein